MIHSARPTVTPVANIVFFLLYCFARFEKWGMDGRTTCAKTIIPTGRGCGLAEWINILTFLMVILVGLLLAFPIGQNSRPEKAHTAYEHSAVPKWYQSKVDGLQDGPNTSAALKCKGDKTSI